MRVGLDEAGRGPVLGPLVIAACGLPPEDIPMLTEAGVRDSKRLTLRRRTELVRWFNHQAQNRGWCSSIVVQSPEEVDEALALDGLNWLEVRGFARAIRELRITSNLDILADACDVNAERFTQRIVTLLPNWPWVNSAMMSEHKADDHDPVVAMASLLAKTTRDAAMEQMEDRVGFPLGSGYPSDPTTKQALHQLILPDRIDEGVRWTWATVTRFWNQHHTGEKPQRGRPHGVQHTLFQADDPSTS